MAHTATRLPQAGEIRRRLDAIEGKSDGFELLTQAGLRRTATELPPCAVVRSTATRRVYLFARQRDAAHWREPCEIIGFDGLRQRLHRRSRRTG